MEVASKVIFWISLLCCVELSVSQLDDEFWDFNTVERTEGEAVDLNCNFTYQDQIEDLVPDYDPEYTTIRADMWMLPNLTLINDTTDVPPGYEISGDNFYLTITSLSRETTGTYHCMLLVNDTEYILIRKGVNLKGPYFISSKELWDETYKNPFIIAISASLGFVAACVLMYLVYMYRWIPDSPEYQSYYTEEQKIDSSDGHMFKNSVAPSDDVELKGYQNKAYNQEQETFAEAPGFVPSPDEARYRLSPSTSVDAKPPSPTTHL